MGIARGEKSMDWKIPTYMHLETSCKSYWKVNICEIGIVLIINLRTTEFDKTVLGQFGLLLFTFQNIWYCLDRTEKTSCLKLSVKVCFLSIKSASPPPPPAFKMFLGMVLVLVCLILFWNEFFCSLFCFFLLLEVFILNLYVRRQKCYL